MATKIVDRILPTTMVGSYPRPHWFKHQLLGRDIRVAFKEVQHEEAYNDAVATVIRDQEEAGLDIVTDGNMWYDDYVGVIGSFCWYMYERIGGFEPRASSTQTVGAPTNQGAEIMDDWGGVINSGPVDPRPDSPRRSLQGRAEARQGAGEGVGRRRPGEPRVARLLQALQGRQGPDHGALPHLQPEMKDLVAAGATYLQFEDLGAWLPLFTGNKDDYKWIRESVEMCCDGVDAKIGWHFCFGNAWGNDILSANYPAGLPDGAAALLRHRGHRRVRARLRQPRHGRRGLPEEPAEGPGHPGRRARHPHQRDRDTGEDCRPHPARSSSTSRPRRSPSASDCGMKPLARMVAKMKLNALADGAAIVRKEIAGEDNHGLKCKIIAVLGSTGSQGGGLCRAILADPKGGFPCRAITRDTEQGQGARRWRRPGAEVVSGNLDDVESLKKAFAGAYGVFAVTNFWEHFSGEKEKAQAKNIAEAAKAAGVQARHLVDARGHAQADAGRTTRACRCCRASTACRTSTPRPKPTPTSPGLPTTFLRDVVLLGQPLHVRAGAEEGRRRAVYSWTFPMGNAKMAGIGAEDIGKAAYGVFKAGTAVHRQDRGIAGEIVLKDMGQKLAKGIGIGPVKYNARRRQRVSAASASPARTRWATCSRSTATSRRK